MATFTEDAADERYAKHEAQISKDLKYEPSKFEIIAEKIGKLVTKKNKAYGNAFIVSAEMLKLVFPGGVKPDQYVDLLLVNRIIDKLLRIANDKMAFGENPFEDLAGYGILGVYAEELCKEEKSQREI